MEAATARNDESLENLLLAKGAISRDQLRIIRLEQHRNPQPLRQLLLAHGFITEVQINEAFSGRPDHESNELAGITVDADTLSLIPRHVAQRHVMFPLAVNHTSKHLTLAIADPNNIVALDQVRALLGNAYRLITRMCNSANILQAIDRHYGYDAPIDNILSEIDPSESEPNPSRLNLNDSGLPLVRLIDALLNDAVRQGASDIHFEPENSFLRIRYRIDGVLRQVRSLQRNHWTSMLVRLKVMCGMNIAETRAPQDGRISLQIAARQIDFRVASHPTTHGENLVLRILDRQKGIVPIDRLGLDDVALDSLKRMIARPEGIVLVCGPTGSGKTTTLYSILNHINRESVNIMTLEDPVEYPLALIRQTSVNETAKLDFSGGIRSLMRQDPDVILVGEIRDHATAEMAFRAAMTGHQVYSTLHANSAIGAIARLRDTGIMPEVMAGNIIGIISQRLLRRLCPHCRKPHKPDTHERALFESFGMTPQQLLHAQGCPRCGQQGYSGRFAIMELLRFDPTLDDLIARHASHRELHQAALDDGFCPLLSDGLQRVLKGETSLTELARVVDLSAYLSMKADHD